MNEFFLKKSIRDNELMLRCVNCDMCMCSTCNDVYRVKLECPVNYEKWNGKKEMRPKFIPLTPATEPDMIW